MNSPKSFGAFLRIGIGLVATASLVALSGCDLQEDADTARGEQLFVQKCGSCHALTAAGTQANVGPNLDYAFKVSRSNGADQDTIEGIVSHQIGYPRPADPKDTHLYMPANLVEGKDLKDVAAYVASVAGVPGIKPPQFVPEEFFVSNCGGCHMLSAAGTQGVTGPNLDQQLVGESPEWIQNAIVNPNSEIAAGYQAGVMPQNFGQVMTPDQLKKLVDYLEKSVNG